MAKANPERIQKVLSRLGVGSRRGIEQLIAEGRVRVNGVTAKIGQPITENAKVTIDNKLIRTKVIEKEHRLLMYHKPTGEMCTRQDPEGRPTVFDHLPKLKNQRWIMIGRLDFHTSGLLLFTTDGELANRMMHPKMEFEREYAVRVLGEVTNETLQALRDGVKLEDGFACFKNIRVGGAPGVNQWFNVIVTEGRNRLVRRLWESQGVTVSRLIRIRYGEYALPRDLRPGYYIDVPEIRSNSVSS